MNAERLKTIVDFLVEAENSTKLQSLLEQLVSSLANQVSNSNQPQFQTETASKLAALETSLQNFLVTLSPAKLNNIAEIKGTQFFSAGLIAEIRQWFSENAITPAVAQQKLQNLH